MEHRVHSVWRRATSIPELGGGGATIGPELCWRAGDVLDGECIVDVGPWLGSTTAYLAMGVVETGWKVPIHSYDRWTVYYGMSKNAFRQSKTIMPNVGESFYKCWAANVADLGVEIIPHKGDVYETEELPDRPIGLLVDDCTVGTLALDALFDRFGPLLAHGAKVIMMDFYHKKRASEFAETPKWFAERAEMFEGPEEVGGARNVAAVFTYTGGWE
jgi:hypothetical protein